MGIEITIKLENCRHCKHDGHTGGFTPGGSIEVCEHPKAGKNKIWPNVHPAGKYGGREMTGQQVVDIPSWCPLKRGEAY
jgi:hypothetical protein